MHSFQVKFVGGYVVCVTAPNRIAAVRDAVEDLRHYCPTIPTVQSVTRLD
jgi:hypothetical protein